MAKKPREDMAPGLPTKDLLRVDEVARYFSVEERTIRLWVDHGYFEVERLGGVIRVLRESVINFRLKSRVKFS